MTGLEALKEIKRLNRQSLITGEYDMLTDEDYNGLYNIIEKELNKSQELYNKIKEKRYKLRLIRKKDKDIDLQKFEISIKICTYNDVLSLMESMFEVLKNE